MVSISLALLHSCLSTITYSAPSIIAKAVSASLVSAPSAKPAELLKNHYFIPTRETETVKGGETLIAQQVSLLQQLVRSLMTSLTPLALTVCWLSIISSICKLLQRPRCWEISVASQLLVIKT